MVKNAAGRVRVRISYFGEGFIQTMQLANINRPRTRCRPVTDNVSFDVSDSVKRCHLAKGFHQRVSDVSLAALFLPRNPSHVSKRVPKYLAAGAARDKNCLTERDNYSVRQR